MHERDEGAPSAIEVLLAIGFVAYIVVSCVSYLLGVVW